MEQQGGLVGPRKDGIVSAERQQKNPNTYTNNTQLDEFLNTIYTFKSDLWPLFLGTLKSQNPEVINRYTEFLSHIYNCIINNKNCNNFLGIYYKNNDDIIQSFLNKIRNYQRTNTINRQTLQYYLKQNLIICQFVYNLNAEKQCVKQQSTKPEISPV